MAIVQNPVTGRTKKKYGSTVFSKSFGKNTMRTKPLDVKNPKTPKQLDQRQKFAIMVALARLFLGFIRVCFKEVAVGMSQFNMFVKLNIRTAITGVYPNYSVDFSMLIVSKGTLTGADDGIATSSGGYNVNITWNDNSGNGDAQSTDNVVVLLINDQKKAIVQDMVSKTRVDGSISITVPISWEGHMAYVYLSFKTPMSDKFSDSSYLGSVPIVP
jgi:hypothetical protein